MELKNLMLYGGLTPFADGKGQNKAEFETNFCGVCSLSNKFFSIIKSTNIFLIICAENFLHEIIFSFLKKICWQVLHNSNILLRERERERERERFEPVGILRA